MPRSSVRRIPDSSSGLRRYVVSAFLYIVGSPHSPEGGGMQRLFRSLRIDLSQFRSFSWPVKIRVRAELPLSAPRKSPVFPVSVSSAIGPDMVLRVLEIPATRPSRRASGRLYWRKAES